MANNVFSYKNRFIIGYVVFDDETGSWCPSSDIDWSSDGCRHIHLITGPKGRFTSHHEAEEFILNAAKAFVDRIASKHPLSR